MGEPAGTDQAETPNQPGSQPSPQPGVPQHEWSRAGGIATYHDNNGSKTVDLSTGRMVFAQTGQQAKAVSDAANHQLRKYEPRPKFMEAVVGGVPKARTQGTAVAKTGGVSSPEPARTPRQGPGWRDISGNWHAGRKSGVLGKQMKGLGGGAVHGGGYTAIAGARHNGPAGQTIGGSAQTTLAARMAKRKRRGYSNWSG